MYRLILSPLHTHRHKQAKEEEKKSQIGQKFNLLVVVVEQQQIEKHRLFSSYSSLLKTFSRQEHDVNCLRNEH